MVFLIAAGFRVRLGTSGHEKDGLGADSPLQMAAAVSSMAQGRSRGETGPRLDFGWLRRILA